VIAPILKVILHRWLEDLILAATRLALLFIQSPFALYGPQRLSLHSIQLFVARHRRFCAADDEPDDMDFF
jgi:hypothetical protein